jgi:hypothetical protein
VVVEALAIKGEKKKTTTNSIHFSSTLLYKKNLHAHTEDLADGRRKRSRLWLLRVRKNKQIQFSSRIEEEFACTYRGFRFRRFLLLPLYI